MREAPKRGTVVEINAFTDAPIHGEVHDVLGYDGGDEWRVTLGFVKPASSPFEYEANIEKRRNWPHESKPEWVVVDPKRARAAEDR